MALLKVTGDFFAIDIGTNAVRVVQLKPSGNDIWSLVHYGYAPLDERISTSDASDTQRQLKEVIMTAIGQSGIKDKDVVIGLPSSKTFTTVIDMPVMSEDELRSTIRYQIDQFILTGDDETKVDWATLGPSLRNPQQQEVLLTSTSNSFAEEKLELIESLGLNVIGSEPESIAMIRSLLPSGISDARLIVDVGMLSTDLAITYNDAPRLVRNIPIGLKSLIKAAVQNLNVQEEQARQFILKFGLAPDRLEGHVYKAIEPTLDNFAAELIKSIKFFQTRYQGAHIGGILLSGYAASVPQFGEYIGAKTSIPCTLANPWQRVVVADADQAQLTPIASEFATVIGLAQRKNLK